MNGSDPVGASVLIVDDVPTNIEALVAVLGDDFELSVATSGAQALDLLTRGHRPDLALLDVMMPGMDGYELCAAMKADPRTRGIPVIFVTAKSDADSESRALGAGAVDFIHKPINKDVVRARVRLHLEVQQLRRLVREAAAGAHERP